MAKKDAGKQAPPDSFQVTQVIGTVHMSPHGDENPTLTAFRIIAEYDNPGTFTFPNAWGGDTTVHVEEPATVNRNEDSTEVY